MRTRHGLVGALIVVLALSGGLLAACGDGDPPRRSASSPSASASSPAATPAESAPTSPSAPAPTRSPSGDEPGGPGASDPATPGEVLVTGEVQAGVEPGCVLLKAPGKEYLLVGGDHSGLPLGGRITVRGRAEPGLMSTCQQGTPLRVLEIRGA